MRLSLFNWFAVGLVSAGAATWSGPSFAGETPDLQKFAIDAVSASPEIAQPAIEALRDAGAAGLAALQEAHQDEITKHRADINADRADPSWQYLSAALDAVGGQRDCYASRLYWYTDFEAAKAAAKKSGKPILSLRLMGKLTDEFSCANSRFFRTTLYANDEVSRVLRERFVLHWQSVRPVPKVTIDFGDGRKLERTLTGNSIHYVLDSQGRVIDALPGLYGPKAFLNGLEQAEGAIAAVQSMSEKARAQFLQEYHRNQADRILAAWKNDLRQLRLIDSNDRPSEQISAAAVNNPAVLASQADDALWATIAQLHAADAKLDDASVALIRSQNPSAGRAAPLTFSKAAVENPMLLIVRKFQNTVAIDTVRNEYTMHWQLHQWLHNGAQSTTWDVDKLNELVYAKLFLTPSNDPWLGLVPADAYTALDNNGVTQQ